MNALKSARVDREWSQARLIAALEAESRRIGIPIAARTSLKTQLSRWENGHRTPDAVYQRLFQRIYGLTASELGFQSDESVGLGVGGTWEQCIESTAELWSEDMERRTFLQTAAFATAGFTSPVFAALINDAPEGVARSSAGRAVSLNDVAVIRDLTASLKRLDNKHGGGHVRRLALTALAEEVNPLLRQGSFTDQVGRELLSAAAELTQLIGWMSHDMGSHGVAQRYLIQALGLARSAGDSALIAELLCAMSQQSTYIRDRQAADLAMAARTVAERRGHVALVAESRLMEAHALARAGSSAACASALHKAEIALDKADRSDEPRWISYFDEAYVSAKFGHCFRELGDHKNAIRFARRSLQMDQSYVRGRAFNLTLLAHAHADAGNLSAACATGHEAIDVIADLSSVRAIGYLKEFRAALDPSSSAPEVKMLDQRLDQVLAA